MEFRQDQELRLDHLLLQVSAQPCYLYTASIKAGTKQIFIKAKTSIFIIAPYHLTCCFMIVAKFAFNMLCIFTCWLITSTLCCWRCVHNHSVAWDDGSIRNGQPGLWVKNKYTELHFERVSVFLCVCVIINCLIITFLSFILIYPHQHLLIYPYICLFNSHQLSSTAQELTHTQSYAHRYTYCCKCLVF